MPITQKDFTDMSVADAYKIEVNKEIEHWITDLKNKMSAEDMLSRDTVIAILESLKVKK